MCLATFGLGKSFKVVFYSNLVPFKIQSTTYGLISAVSGTEEFIYYVYSHMTNCNLVFINLILLLSYF